MKILLTGASGFLGSALALKLSKPGHEVSLLLRPGSDLKRLKGCESSFLIGRYADEKDLKAFVKEVSPEVVVNTVCAYGRQGETILEIEDANLRFGLSLIEALQKMDRPTSFINTGTGLSPGISFYALSKSQFSEWGRMTADSASCKFRFINVLLEHMYGPGDSESKFTTHVLHACHRQQPILELTAGEQVRDFIYIDDVVSAYETIITNIPSLGSVEEIAVGSGEAHTIRRFVELVHRLTGSHTSLKFGAIPYRQNEMMYAKADITRMKLWGWKPVFDLESGLKKTIELEF